MSSGSPILRVLVAGENQTGFRTQSVNSMDQGVVNLGGSGTGAGLKVYNSGNSGDHSLRDATRVAIAVSGDLTGDITVAEVYRVQADGNIAAAINANNALHATTGLSAIGYVVCGDTISAEITASAGDIDAVTVGPSGSAGGVLANVTAASGHIGKVTSTGPIGNGTTAANITARDGIENISATSITGDITANTNGGAGNIFEIITTAGDLNGAVVLNDLGVDDDNAASGGIIVAGKSGSIEIDGDMLKSIKIGQTSSDPPDEVYLHSLVVYGNLRKDVIVNGNIGSVEVYGDMSAGDYPPIPRIFGGIYTDSIHVHGDAYGATLESADTRPIFTGRGSIGSLVVDGNAGIVLIHFPYYTGVIDVGHLEIGGNMMGSVQLGSFEECIIRGSILDDPESDQSTGVSIESIGAENAVIIGDSIDGGSIYIGDSVSDCAGQIVVNANAGAGDLSADLFEVGQWPDNVYLSPLPYYDNLSSTIGGGAVGLVPYHLHETDCVPAQYAGLCYDSDNFNYAPNSGKQTGVLRFYGRVINSRTDSTPPVIVYAAPENNPYSRSDITAYCDVVVAPSGHPREVWVSPKSSAPFYDDFYYNSAYIVITVVPRQTESVNDLRCDDTFAEEPPPVADFEYVVSPICPLFMLDMDQSGTVDVDDVSVWGASPVDINRSGGADSDDLMLIVNAIE